MGLFNAIKSKLSHKNGSTTKEEKERKELNESVLANEKEEARWEAYCKGSIERAKAEGYTQGKTPQAKGIGKGIFGKLGDIGAAANRGLDFLNQDSLFELRPKPKGKKGKKKKKTSMFDIGF